MNDWISVKEKVPLEFDDVLCFCEQLDDTATFEKGKRYFCIDQWVEWTDGWGHSFRTDRFYGARVTHWMPLPKPPERLS